MMTALSHTAVYYQRMLCVTKQRTTKAKVFDNNDDEAGAHCWVVSKLKAAAEALNCVKSNPALSQCIPMPMSFCTFHNPRLLGQETSKTPSNPSYDMADDDEEPFVGWCQSSSRSQH